MASVVEGVVVSVVAIAEAYLSSDAPGSALGSGLLSAGAARASATIPPSLGERDFGERDFGERGFGERSFGEWHIGERNSPRAQRSSTLVCVFRPLGPPLHPPLPGMVDVSKAVMLGLGWAYMSK